MKTQISGKPAQEAGAFITQKLLAHAHQPVLFLLSGGSAFDVLEHIKDTALGNNITLALTDDRFTYDAKGNNFLQLKETCFFKNATEVGVVCVFSAPMEGERHEQFAERATKELEEYMNANTQRYAIGLFGIGEDGHTASIFPTTEVEFKEAYRSDSPYVAITKPEQVYPFRITLTPAFIEERIDEVILYAVGSKKCDNILSYMHTKNFGAHEIPALIPARHPESILFTDCEALL